MRQRHRRPIAVLLVATLSACAGPGPASPGPTSPGPRSAVPTVAPSRSPVVWPAGVVAYPVGSSPSPLPYLEYLPQDYEQGSPRPLLIYLHGVDEVANGSEASLHDILRLGVPALIAAGAWPSNRPFVVLMPQEPAAKSARCDFGPEVEAFLDFAVDRYEIDLARIYLTGISCGAIGVWDYLATTTTDRVAAALPISGHPAWAMEKAGCDVAHVPIWVFHGALDDTVPVDYVRDKIDKLRACTDPRPTELELTIYADADHDAWTRTYDLSAGRDVYAWLLEHSKKPAH